MSHQPRVTKWTIALLAVALSVGLVPSVQAQQPEPDAAMKAMMAAWTAYATPGEAHKRLAKRVGAWSVKVKFWMAPGTEPQLSDGTSEITAIMGGRYLVEKFRSQLLEGPFEGMSISGYDNIKKKYVSVWVDSMSTGILANEGSTDPGGKSMTFWGQTPDPVAGKYKKTRAVETTIDEKSFRFQSYDIGPDGKEFLAMEMVYART